MRVRETPRQVDAALAKLLAARTVVRFDRERGAVIHEQPLAELRRSAVAAVDDFHRLEPMKPGLPREELRSKLPPEVAPRLFHLLVEGLVGDGELAVDRDLVRRPRHDVQAAQRAGGLAPLAERVAAAYQKAGLAPPRPAELQAALGAPEKGVKEAVELLTRSGALLKIADLHFDRAAVAALKEKLIAFLAARGQITAQEWKDLVGQTRKYTIPLAEHFDAEKVTLRVGEIRKLRR